MTPMQLHFAQLQQAVEEEREEIAEMFDELAKAHGDAALDEKTVPELRQHFSYLYSIYSEAATMVRNRGRAALRESEAKE